MTKPDIKQQGEQLTAECQNLSIQIEQKNLSDSERSKLVSELEDNAHQLLPLLEEYPNEEARKLVVGILKQRLARLESLSDNAMLAIDRKMYALDQIVTNLEKKARSKIN